MVMKKTNSTVKIGITGNICSGKSTILHFMARHGVNTMDAMEVGLNFISENPHRLSFRLTDHFGAEVMDQRGRLSRKKLMAVLYASPEKKAFFEERMDPIIREEIKRFMYSQMGSHFRAVESPSLLETDTSHLYDEVWVIKTDPEQQLKRLMEKGHLSAAEAQQLIVAEWPQEQKLSLATRVIDNSGDLPHTEQQVRKALDEIKNRIFKPSL